MATPRPILIVEDDAALRATLAEQIAMEGDFTADEAESAAEATAKLADGDVRYDAILLDIGLPDGDGRDFCAKLRRDGKRMPVIMLTGADAESDVVRGLDAGANDYIAKPFHLSELLARVLAQLRVPSVPMTLRQRAPGILDLRARKDYLADAHAPHPG